MIWIIRLFLIAYAVLYFGIGAWAIIDPVKDALELSYEIPSFMDAVGLKVSGVDRLFRSCRFVWWYQYDYWDLVPAGSF